MGGISGINSLPVKFHTGVWSIDIQWSSCRLPLTTNIPLLVAVVSSAPPEWWQVEPMKLWLLSHPLATHWTYHSSTHRPVPAPVAERPGWVERSIVVPSNLTESKKVHAMIHCISSSITWCHYDVIMQFVQLFRYRDVCAWCIVSGL